MYGGWFLYCMHKCFVYTFAVQAELEQAEERIRAKQSEVEELLIQVQYTCKMFMYVCVCMYMYICWLLLGNQHFKGPYLEAEVVEEATGWLG